MVTGRRCWVHVPCETCGTEGRIIRGQYEDEYDAGICHDCHGSGMECVPAEEVECEEEPDR